MHTNTPPFPLRRIMLWCLLLVMAVPQVVFAADGDFKGLWPSLSQPWYFNQPGAVTVDVGGNVYVADTKNNRIQKFDAGGTFQAMWGSSGSGDGQFDQPQALVAAADGNIYVADTNNHRIQKFDSSGLFQSAWGTSGSGDGQFGQPQGIAADAGGNIYVADTGNNRIQKFDSSGAFLAQWGSFGAGTGMFDAPHGIAVGPDGTIYVADMQNNRIQTFDSSGVFQAAWGSYGTSSGQFSNPAGISVDSSGNVYVADYSNNRIQQFDSSGNFAATWGDAGSGTTQFNLPRGIAVGSGGAIYVADTQNSRIQTFDATGTFVSSWASRGSGNGYFATPNAVAVDSGGNVYVADTFNSRIQKFDAGGTYQASWNAADSPVGPITTPYGVAVDTDGNIYVADTFNNRIQKLDPSGTFLTAWDSSGSAAGTLSGPYGIAVDAAGAVYVVDAQNSRIQKFDAGGTYVTSWGQAGSDDGMFAASTGIALDSGGNVYVADTGNNRVQKFDSAGAHLASWGAQGSGDGQFEGPRGVVVDSGGSVYVSDTGNNRIQKLDSSGTFISAWGSTGSDNGKFFIPAGIALAANGNFYVADSNNSRIQYFGVTVPVPDTTKPVVSTFTVTPQANSLTIPVTAFTATDNVDVTGYLITETATPPLASADGWSDTAPASYTVVAEGVNTLYAWAKDAAGNVSLARIATTTVDLIKPAVTVFTVPAVVKSLTITGIAITAVDNIGLGAYQITESDSAPDAGDVNWKSTKPTSYVLAADTPDGSKTLYAWAKDKAGNVSESASATFSVMAPPMVSTFAVPATSTSLTVPVTSFTATDNTGVTGYLITLTATVPLASADGWSDTAPDSYTAATEGVKTLYAWAKDAAGNVSPAKTAIVTIDFTVPVVTAFTIPATAKSLTVPVTTLTATDNVAVSAYLITESADVPDVADPAWKSAKPTSYLCAGDSEDGLKTLYVWARDAVGNVSLSKSATVTIDRVVPSVTDFTVPALVNSLTVPVTTFTATDDGTGVAGYLITLTATPPLPTAAGWSATAPTGYTAIAGGAKTLYAWVKDLAGNVSASASAVVTIDVTKPVVSTFTVTSLVSDGLIIPLTAFIATDNIAVAGYQVTLTGTAPLAGAAGWSDTAPDSYTVATEGIKTLYAWAKDTAGNVSLAKTAGATVDLTQPVVTTFTLPVAVKSLTVPISALTATDNVAVTAYQITESSDAPAANDANWKSAKPTSYIFAGGTMDGSKTLYAWTRDVVGNVSAVKSATVTIDTGVPSVTDFSVPALVNSLTVPVTTLTATDGGTAVAGYLITTTATAPLPTATGWSAVKPATFRAVAAGALTLYAWAKDTVGNVSASASAPVTIDLAKPLVGAFTVTTPVSSLSIPVTAFTATDNIAITGYLITETATAPSAASPAWSGSAPASYTAATVGAKTLYAWIRDSAGNVSLARAASAIVDQAKPVVTIFAIPAVVKSLAVPVTLTATDNVAVGGYQITGSSTAPDAADVNWKTAKPTSYLFAADTPDGPKTLYAWAKDKAGNVSLAKSATFSLMVPPVVSAFTITPLISDSLTIPITAFSATDNTGVTGYQITLTATPPLVGSAGWSATAPTSYTVTSEGTKTLYAWARDAAGNVSPARAASATVDRTKPVVTAFSMRPAIAGLVAPLHTLTVTDNIAVTAYQITESATAPAADDTHWSPKLPYTYTFAGDTEDGLKTLYAWARDKVGNVSLSKSATVTIDHTAPSVTAFSVPATFNSLTVPVTTFTGSDIGTNVAGYKITLTATPPLATAVGWSATKPVSARVAVAGTTTLYAWVKDAAGNVSASSSAAIFVDLARPVVNAFTITSPVTDSLTIPITAFTASDTTGVTGYQITLTSTVPLANAAGWNGTAPTSYTVTTEGGKTLYAWAKDAAGNVSLARAAGAMVDKTAPVVSTFTVPAVVKGLSVPVTALAVTDNVAVAAYQITESSTAPAANDVNWATTKPTRYLFASGTAGGLKTLYAWGRDKAGNVSLAKSVAVTLQP